MSDGPILKVAVNAPLRRTFDYLLPRENAELALPGCRVRVPFGRRRQTAMVLEVAAGSDLPASKLKRADALLDEKPLLSESDLWLIRFTSDYYHHPIGECVAAALPALLRQGRALQLSFSVLELTAAGVACPSETLKRAPRQAELLAHLQATGGSRFDALDDAVTSWRRSKTGLVEKGLAVVREIQDNDNHMATPDGALPGPTLNPEQQHAVDAILGTDGFRATLLDGVTGSGKTEVYLRVMQQVLAAGGQVLILVPEIGLTSQFVARLQERLGVPPVLLHSALTDAARLSAWRSAHDGSAGIVLGTRSAVFVPLKNPGLIVVDEEHDTSFKQQEGLRYSARDLSIARAKHLDIPVVLGSATPSIETASHAEAGNYQHLTLTARAGGALPPLLRLIDLNRHPADDGLSDPLASAMEKHLSRDGQVLIFLNRRGFAPTLICSDCGHIAECQRCDSRMTVHRGDSLLNCHHCGANRPLDAACSECGARCVPLGHGTERIEDTLRARFPAHAITRIDSDSTRLKGTMDKALSLAVSGDARILVGTQMLSKGHHFPRLTLVGVINADQGLFSTDFRGAERLAQSLTQVAGRAGRERQQGEVFIQTAFAAHPFWSELLTGGYHQVARYALSERQATGWPPCSYLALIRASATKREHTWAFLDHAARASAGQPIDGVRVLGPLAPRWSAGRVASVAASVAKPESPGPAPGLARTAAGARGQRQRAPCPLDD